MIILVKIVLVQLQAVIINNYFFLMILSNLLKKLLLACTQCFDYADLVPASGPGTCTCKEGFFTVVNTSNPCTNRSTDCL